MVYGVPPSHQWIVGICSVVFDIDVGQRIEHCVPAGCLSVNEKQDVAFHSFPDSMSMELHARTSIKDSTFFFRVRRRGTPEAVAEAAAAAAAAAATTAVEAAAVEAVAVANGAAPSADGDAAGAAAASASSAPSAAAPAASGASSTGGGGDALMHSEERFLYGFVFCRQRQDPALRRGGEQHSVVVLAEHPLSAALVPLSAVAGQQYFGQQGAPALQQVYDDVLRWPPPVAGPQLQLPVGFTSLAARLPAWATLPHPSTTTAPEQYGANTLPHLRGMGSSRSIQLGGNSRRGGSISLEEGAGSGYGGAGGGVGGGPPQSVSRVSSGLGPLSPAGSNASLQGGLLSPPAAGAGTGAAGGAAGAGGMAAPVFFSTGGAPSPSPSPFSSSGGQQQAVKSFPGATGADPSTPPAMSGPPAQQELERRRSSPGLGPGMGQGQGPVSPGHGTSTSNGGGGGEGGGGGGIASRGMSFTGAAAELSLSAGMAPGLAGLAGLGGSGGLAGLAAAALGGSHGGSRESSLQRISGMLEGCAPGTATAVPAMLPSPSYGGRNSTGGGGVGGLQQRSRSSVQVPSRQPSYAGVAFLEEAQPPGGNNSNSNNDSSSGAAVGGLARLQVQGSDGLQGEEANGGGAASGRFTPVFRRNSSALQAMAPAEGGAVHGAFHEVDMYTPLSGHLPRLWQLWEMALLGRPLLLVAPSPGEASAGVAALVSLAAPLPYSPDFRPYYVIHDAAFSAMAAGGLPGPEAREVPTLLGVTNLYFLRALPHWPNVLSIGKREGAAAAAVPPSGSLAAAASVFNANAAVQAIRQRAQGATVLLSGHTEALWSSYKPLCRTDQALLNRLIKPAAGDVKSKVARIAFVNSDAIRRHFAELTTAFLSPFGRYFEPGPDGRVPGWNSEEFLFGLRSGEATLPQPLMDRVGNASAAVELYARFTSCLNFAAWFAARRRHVAHLIRPPPGGAGGGGAGGGEEGADGWGMSGWFRSAAQHVDEVKLIGMFFSVEQQLAEAQAEAASPDAGDEAGASVSRLQRELALLFFGGGMPEELQLTCISSPARASLLAGLPLLTAPQAARLQQLLDMLQGG